MIKKRGQVTIFVIAAILIVLAVVMFLLIKNKMVPGIGVQQEIEPRMFFSSCIETDLRNSLELISLQGGYIKNKLNRGFQFEG